MSSGLNDWLDCENCVCWFLGCLNGRKKWKDKAITPNLRCVGQSGKEYPYESSPSPSLDDYPLKTYCDDFDLNKKKTDLFDFLKPIAI